VPYKSLSSFSTVYLSLLYIPSSFLSTIHPPLFIPRPPNSPRHAQLYISPLLLSTVHPPLFFTISSLLLHHSTTLFFFLQFQNISCFVPILFFIPVHFSFLSVYRSLYLKKAFLAYQQIWFHVRFQVFTAVTKKNDVIWGINIKLLPHRRHIKSPLQSPTG
jgi:hypothetical protein